MEGEIENQWEIKMVMCWVGLYGILCSRPPCFSLGTSPSSHFTEDIWIYASDIPHLKLE